MPSELGLAAAVLFGTGAGTWLATGLTLRIVRRHNILDHPNERSSHAAATPRGGGLGIVFVLLPVWLGLALTDRQSDGQVLWVLAGTAVIALVAWQDDRRGLPPWPRLASQVVAVGLGLLALSDRPGIFQGLFPAWLDLSLAGIAWLWFINLFNFMDGIDGLAGVETVAIGGGLFLVAQSSGLDGEGALLALALAGSAIGFLWWNWQPARIFLGDVGSIPLGYLLGWLLLLAATQGHWQAALILPLYFLADASLTLARRLLRGARIWEAHREHFYQAAVVRGMSHAQVSGAVLATNIGLAALAVVSAWPGVSPGGIPWALALAAGLVALLFWYLARGRPARA